MERSKRTPKTPKRFDDEAFTPALEPKTIIKVKLTKPKIRLSPSVTPKAREPREPKEPKEQKEPKEPREPKKIKAAKEPKEPREQKPKELKDQEPKELRDPEPSKPKQQVIKPEEPIKIEPIIRIPDRLVDRPKVKRARTPPIYSDLIPNTKLPFWDARTAAEDHEDDNVKELVHCHCGISEELGLIVQCETCLTWQHAQCLGIEKPEEAPDSYTCKSCSDPKFARESMKWAYDQDWLTKGRMKQFPCDPNPLPEKKSNSLKQINQLIASVLNIHQIIHSLRIKTRILVEASDDDADLKLFKVQWPATYQHADGTPFIPSVNNPDSPASTLSAIGDTPDLADITDLDIGPLVSNVLENTCPQQPPLNPNDCRTNLKLHIEQTKEFISIELTHIEEQLAFLEKQEDPGNNPVPPVDSLKNDLISIKKYISSVVYVGGSASVFAR